MNNDDIAPGTIIKWILLIVTVLILVVGLGVAGCAGCNSFNRGQKLADARNRTKITKQQIRTAEQQALVTQANDAHVKALADQRLIEATGIRHAQDEISKTLTPLYIQHEAIQAQEKVATSGQNNTIIYTPSGANGVPLVQTPPIRPVNP